MAWRGRGVWRPTRGCPPGSVSRPKKRNGPGRVRRRGPFLPDVGSVLLLGPFGPLDEGPVHVPDVVVEVRRRAAHDRRKRAAAAGRLDAVVVEGRVVAVLVEPAR